MKHHVLALILLAAALPALAESGRVIRNTDIKQKPFLDASSLGAIPSGTRVELLNRQGAWLQVKAADGRNGWIKLLNVRTEGSSSTGQSISQTASTLSSLYKTGSSGTTVTTGVKGLSKEQIEQAKPNPAEVERLKHLGVSAAEAQNTAAANRLVHRQVAAIDVD